MGIEHDFDTILDYAHMLNWAPDWEVLRDVYKSHKNAYSILTPFAYSYLEELIRSTTSQYGRDYPADQRVVGKRLLRLARNENASNAEYISILDGISRYFDQSSSFDREIIDIAPNMDSCIQGFGHKNRSSSLFTILRCCLPMLVFDGTVLIHVRITSLSRMIYR